MSNYERAVIEAARALVDFHMSMKVAWPSSHGFALQSRVTALELHEQQQAATGTSEIEWSLVAAGDELRGKSGAFFPVIRTRCEYDMGKTTGRYVIEVGMPGGPKSIVRPHANEPFATVKRGQDGRAVDEFVNVFSSGEE